MLLSSQKYLHHEPEFEGVHLAPTLDGLVPSVVVHIVELVLEYPNYVHSIHRKDSFIPQEHGKNC